MRCLAVFIAGYLYFLAGCTIIQREATTASAIEDMFPVRSSPRAASGSIKNKSKRVAPTASSAVAKLGKRKLFCSVCGRKFSSSVEYCPYDGTALKP